MDIRRAAASHAALAVLLIAIVAAGSLVAACGTESLTQAGLPAPSSGVAASLTATLATDAHPDVIAFIKQQNLYTVRTNGEELKLIARDALFAAWSPDGGQLAYSPARRYGLYVVDADGSHPHKIAGARAGGMAWSPDGRQIVYSNSVGMFTSQLVIVNADGSGKPVPLTSGACVDADPVWSPDGRIFFSRKERGIVEIATIDPDGSDLETVTAARGVTDFALSPDGKWLLVVDGRSGGCVRMLTSGRGGETVVLGAPGCAHLSWSADGSKIAFACTPRWQPQRHRLESGWPGHAWAVYIVDADGSSLQKVPNTDKGGEPVWRPY